MCRERSGPYPEILPETHEELSALYNLKLEAKEYLEAPGVTVSEPPSRQQWIEDYTSDSWDLWRLWGVKPLSLTVTSARTRTSGTCMASTSMPGRHRPGARLCFSYWAVISRLDGLVWLACGRVRVE